MFAPLKRSIVLNEMKWCAVDLLSAALTLAARRVYVWQARGRGEALLIGSVFMIYTYAQQAGGVIGSMAANFQGFARARTDYASADLIWRAPERATAAPRSTPTGSASTSSTWTTTRRAAAAARRARGPRRERRTRRGLKGVSLTCGAANESRWSARAARARAR